MGQAFTSNRNAVFDSIQRLRSQAQAAGNLQSTPQQQMSTRTGQGGQQTIVIQPANPQVVCVPQSDATNVYSQPAYGAGAAAVGFASGVIVEVAADGEAHHYGSNHPVGCCSAERWSNCAPYRQGMANGYYDHSQAMATQRGSEVSHNEAARQDAVSQNQSSRQNAAMASEAATSRNPGQAESAMSSNQANRQAAASSQEGAANNH